MGYITLVEKHGHKITLKFKGEGTLKRGDGVDPSATLDESFAFKAMNLTDDEPTTKPTDQAPPTEPPTNPETTGENETVSTTATLEETPQEQPLVS